MEKIRLAVVGIGNCASSLIQGIEYYRTHEGAEKMGLMHFQLGGYTPGDMEVVAAFDIDRRKVGRPLREAIFAPPNCTQTISPEISDSQTIVSMGPVLDGVSEHMRNYPESQRFVVAEEKPCDVEKVLRKSGAEILLNYLPVGSEEAARFYATCCLNTGVSLINCMPVFIVSNPEWARRFAERNIPVIGDDVKSQLGATILHRMLAQLFTERGVKIDRTYQLNTGGNTDFLNMLNQRRLVSKKISKTEAVQSILGTPLEPDNIHIGPSDYVPWQKDNKVCFLRIEGRGFGGVPLNLELRLSVEDSPNSGGVTIDSIRCCKIARERKIGGPLTSISAYAMKHPPEQVPDPLGRQYLEEFILGLRER
ncbi:MAG: inositol-3-phosphate synthase [Deltaproteobacteria bacterium]|nr:inositol-3-phosphate synthase [Deltaproteobacteria bacterium]